jgi:glutamate formiminotransferase/glutamate formiminotransferase/formiminotetrahydrofolate cyclodeaminase
VSEGRDQAVISAVADALTAGSGADGVRLLDIHSDADHHRSVFTVAGAGPLLVDRLLAAARIALERIDVVETDAGSRQHPHVGAVDVAPIVYVDPEQRGAACATALVLADRIGEELGVPVFLYGELTADDSRPGRTRAQLRRGGVRGLAERMSGTGSAGEPALRPDFGPPRIHPTAGATLVAARPPLVAFNLQLAPPAGIERAREIASEIRESAAGGLPGVRAIGVLLAGDVAQVSMNIERPFDISLAQVVAAVRERAPVASAELVGLAPAAAMAGFPDDLAMPGFEPSRHLLENALGS